MSEPTERPWTETPPARMCIPRPRRGSHPGFPLGAHVGDHPQDQHDPHAAYRIPHATYAAMEPAAKWPAGSELTFALGPGPKALQDEFREAVKTVAATGINLTFRELLPGEDTAKPADCRVEFINDGSSWSDVGQDCRLVPLNLATTHIGWPDDLARSIHEFMHFLGWMHNQAIPNTYLHLDPAKCYAYFGGPPNNWDKATVDSQVLYIFSGAYIGSGFDAASIMQYSVDPSLTTDGVGIPWNQELSTGDIHDLRTVYAIAAPPVPPTTPPTPTTPTPTIAAPPPTAPTPPTNPSPLSPPEPPTAPVVAPTAPPLTPPPTVKGPIVQSFIPLLLQWLAFINGIMDVAKLIQVVTDAESKELSLESGIKAIKENETAIFKTTLGRLAADEALSILLAIYQRGIADHAGGHLSALQFDAGVAAVASA